MKADTPPRDPPRVPVMVTLVNGGGEPSQRVVAKTVESRDEIAKNVEHFPMLSRGAARSASTTTLKHGILELPLC